MKKTLNLKEDTREELIEIKNDQGFLISCETFYGEHEDFVPWHWHLPLEIFYIEKGSLLYELNDDRTIEFKEDEAGILNSDILHMTKVNNRITTVQKVLLCPLTFLADSDNIIYQKYILPLISSDIEILHFKADDDVSGLIKQLFMIKPTEIGYEMLILELLMRILLMLYREDIINDHLTKRKRNAKIKEALFFIYSNYQDDITAKDIASSCRISERQLYRLFKDNLAVSLITYLIEWRIDQAANSLVNTDKTITEICFDCGFKSASYFSKKFKEFTGYTPKQYRLKRQNNYIN